MEGRDPRTQKYTPLSPLPMIDVDRLGGETFVEKLVAAFHDKITNDPVISTFFARSSPERAMAMEREYITVSLGGKGRFSPSNLREAHVGRGITDVHFRRFLDLYLETLREHQVDEHSIDHVLDRLAIASTDVLDANTEVG
jgi:hemoglobin